MMEMTGWIKTLFFWKLWHNLLDEICLPWHNFFKDIFYGLISRLSTCHLLIICGKVLSYHSIVWNNIEPRHLVMLKRKRYFPSENSFLEKENHSGRIPERQCLYSSWDILKRSMIRRRAKDSRMSCFHVLEQSPTW